ncbi:hypothetical protein KK083_29725 [Fulvivirgaceae bacterium PWU4]|uniref:DUF4840 domain-containing protein n=1 Tax=Chryseosolibacter histidini TaxID=2782349 RepID=A0AAP2GMC7_9BACT|nr:hypothetical protein [Chryseosolibacter histidini]MBT1701109.1 hypothetical protein [Chryseosolibacter histidini]
MKNLVLRSLAIFIFTAVVLTSCDELGDVTINEPVTTSITVDETGTNQNVTYSKSLVVDATSNAEIEKYKDNLKSFTVNKITFKIKNYSGEAATTPLSKVSYSATGSAANAIEIASITNFNIKAAADAGTETELVVSNTDLQAMAAILKNNLSITLYLNGSLTKTPVKFTAEFTVDATIVANALNN